MFGGNGLSLADIAAVTRNNDGGFGGDGGGWWALIIILALFGGFGGDGNGLFGNRGGSTGTAAVEASVQRGFDTQGIVNKLNGLENGICSLGYDQLSQMNGINSNIMQTGFGISNAINAANIANMQQGNSLTAQIQQCCCNLESLLAQANYNRATDTCAITTAINQAAQSIMQNDNCNYRQLHDEMVASQMAAKDAEITRLTSALDRCSNREDNLAQTNMIINTLRPAPVPAYTVANPYAYYGNGCGCNGGFYNNCCA